MPVDAADADRVGQTLDSVCAQTYANWQLCVATTPGVGASVQELLQAHARCDPRVVSICGSGARDQPALLNAALELARGEFVAVLDLGGTLRPDALAAVAEEIGSKAGVVLLYSDEEGPEEVGRGARSVFKPDWNYDLFLCSNYLGRILFCATEQVRMLGGFRDNFEGAHEYDLALRLVRGHEERIGHIARVLYRRGRAEDVCGDAARGAVARHLVDLGIAADVLPAPEAPGKLRVRYQLPAERPGVTLIIPTRDNAKLLRICIESILDRTAYGPLELMVVDNGSNDPATLSYLASLSARNCVRVQHDDQPFNYSGLNNRAVKEARTPFIGLLNDDIEVIDGDWLREMVSQACRPAVGAVGARLWYPHGTLQHGGIILGLGGVAGTAHKGLGRGDRGYMDRGVLQQNFSAVTGACLVIRKSIYEEVGGLDETLAVAFNDVDFCLRVRSKGYRNVWTPYAELVHHESATRGLEDTPAKRKRFLKEAIIMRERWGHALLCDPAYNPNLTLDREDFGLSSSQLSAVVTA